MNSVEMISTAPQQARPGDSLPQRIGLKSLLFVIVAAAVWAGAVHLRPHTLDTHCVSNPSGCTADQVHALDRIAIGREDRAADSRSFDTQHWASTLAIVGPWAWMISLFFLGRISLLPALKFAAIDVVVVLQSYLANGVLNELVKTFAERPRPFVYSDPARLGVDPAHYTSFYSGHASFTAVSAIALVLALKRRGAPAPVLSIAAFAGGSLALATAYYRVISGRHFPSDVMAGLVIGSIVAIAVSHLHVRAHRLASASPSR